MKKMGMNEILPGLSPLTDPMTPSLYCRRQQMLIGLACFLWLLLQPTPSIAGDVSLLSLSARYGLSGSSPIGEQTQKDFRQYDVAATFRLPWQWYHASGWGLSTRLVLSGGVLTGANETNAIATVVPVVAFGRQDERFSIDMGGGGALLSDYKFGTQNFGGPFQFVWTFGMNLLLYSPVGVAYHFQHYSDATIYGSDARGVDLHMFELVYRY